MCTVSWLHSSGGYQVLCNRDEKYTRKPALEPRVQVREGVRFVAPADGDFGGAWIAANEFGVTLALLNGVERRPAVRRRSRGLLVLDLIPESSLGALHNRLLRTSLGGYAPFSLAALAPGQPALLFEWSGRLTVTADAEHRMPLTSSSFDPEAVRERRQDEFRRLVTAAGGVNAPALFRFHASHAPGRGAYSPCMHRSDASTASFSWVGVSPSKVRFYYSPEAPCIRRPRNTASVELTR